MVAYAEALSLGSWRSSEDSSGLFSWGFTVDRTTINLLSTSNQKGAPSITANAVTRQPHRTIHQSDASHSERWHGSLLDDDLPEMSCRPSAFA